MTDEEALALAPALREFVDAVNAQDALIVQAALTHTDPAALAVLAAGWIGELLDDADAMQEEVIELQRQAAQFGGTDVATAWRAQKARADRLEAKLAGKDELIRDLQGQLTKIMPGHRAELAAAKAAERRTTW